MNARVRAAVLKTLMDAVKAEYARARAEADIELAAAHETEGVSKVDIRLPGGQTVATMSVGLAKTPLHIDQDELVAWVVKAHPTEVTARTVAEIRPQFLRVLLAQLEADGDVVVHKGTGEIVQWARPGVPGPAPTSLTFARGGREEVMAAWRGGRLDVGGPLAIGVAEGRP